MQGYLATIKSQEEAFGRGAKQLEVRRGRGRHLEMGRGPDCVLGRIKNGSTPNFAFWNEGEPNNLENEDYAHITDDSIGIEGSWNDLPNQTKTSGPFQAKGYVVEYGGMPEILNSIFPPAPA